MFLKALHSLSPVWLKRKKPQRARRENRKERKGNLCLPNSLFPIPRDSVKTSVCFVVKKQNRKERKGAFSKAQ